MKFQGKITASSFTFEHAAGNYATMRVEGWTKLPNKNPQKIEITLEGADANETFQLYKTLLEQGELPITFILGEVE